MNSKIPKLPKRISIVGRISSITNAYVNGIIPLIEPTEEQIRDALRVLGMTEETIECAYCGDSCTEWDHLNPLVENKKPTGYITEIHNLMPSCATCNQSKGNQNWRKWIYSDAPKSPHSRGIKDLDERVARIDAYVSKFNPVRLNFEDIVGHCKWESYQQSLLELEEHMRQCQNLQDEVATQITEAYERSAVDRTSSNNDDEPSSALSEQSCDSKKVSNLVRGGCGPPVPDLPGPTFCPHPSGNFVGSMALIAISRAGRQISLRHKKSPTHRAFPGVDRSLPPLLRLFYNVGQAVRPATIRYLQTARRQGSVGVAM